MNKSTCVSHLDSPPNQNSEAPSIDAITIIDAVNGNMIRSPVRKTFKMRSQNSHIQPFALKKAVYIFRLSQIKYNSDIVAKK